MEAPSLPVLRILCSQYNKARKKATKQAPRLSKDELLKLATAIEEKLDCNPPSSPTKLEALQYMGTLLVAFLSFTLPQRAQVTSMYVRVGTARFICNCTCQVLKALQLGSTIKKLDNGVWVMSATHTKNGQILQEFEVIRASGVNSSITNSQCALTMQLPQFLGNWTDKYLSSFRNVLVSNQEEKTFFVTYSGAPRRDIHALCSGAVNRLVGITVPPHAFRTIVASALYESGTRAEELLLVRTI
jgi:hypothetical protein